MLAMAFTPLFVNDDDDLDDDDDDDATMMRPIMI